MLLECNATFNLQEDVVPWILQQSAPDNLERISKTIQILNVERNGRIIFTWKEAEDFTGIGLYDLKAPQCELLYSFDRDLHIISCSVNNEKTLLALSYCNPSGTPRYERLTPVSRYLALLIEIQPINNVRVLKAVDSSIQVQFLYPIGDEQLFPESHLLVVSEEKYIDHFHVRVAIEDDNRVVIDHSGQLPRDRVAEDFVWAQWDMSEQSLFYITPKHSSCVLHCVQFYPSENFKHILEVPIEVELVHHGVSLVNLGCDLSVDRDQTGSPAPNLQVFTNPTGGLCLLYVQPFTVAQEVSYMVEFIHKGYCKTFKVSTTAKDFSQLKVSFLDLDGYVAVYLPNYFLHLIDTSHPDLTCCYFFLEGDDARIRGLCSDYCIGSTSKASVIQPHTGILYSVQIHHLLLLKVLWSAREDSRRLAALHCALLHMDQTSHWDTQIIEWICENLSTCHSFDPMQEFIVAYLYRKLSLDTYYLDKILPYTSVPFWNEVIEGVSCSIDIIDMPILKMGTFKGFWEKFHSELEYIKHTQQRFLYNNHVPRKNWYKLISEVDTEKRNLIYQRSILENAKKVILNMDRRKSDEKCVPLYQEEDFLQKDLMGLVMLKLKDHLSLHLPHVGKNKIDKIVLDYVSKQMDLICLILEVVWKKYNIERGAFCFTGKGTPPEYFAFHVMCHISEVTSKLCMLLPPGFHTLHLVLGVRCLPLANLLHFIDSGVLQLTETFVVKLLKELDDSENNEKLKCSIILRLPETICSKFHHLWDHTISNNLIAMNYVKRSLTKFKKREQLTRQTVTEPSSLYIDFLPLNYLIKMLSEVEDQALNPFEEDNIDAAYLEEIALKQTTQLLGLQRK